MLWDNWGDERGCDEGLWCALTRGLPWGLPEVVGTVQQMHFSRRRLLQRGLEFHVCTINKSAHTKKVWKLIVCTSYNEPDSPTSRHKITLDSLCWHAIKIIQSINQSIYFRFKLIHSQVLIYDRKIINPWNIFLKVSVYIYSTPASKQDAHKFNF